MRYAPLDTLGQRPPRGTVGVYSTSDSIWLRTWQGYNTLAEIRQVGHGDTASIYGPSVVAATSVPDGDFSSPLKDVWVAQQGLVASASRDASTYSSRPAALRVVGTNRTGPVATTVTQTLDLRGLRTSAGARLEVALVAKSQNLSRPVSVELKLLYADGSYQFFPATSRQSQGSVAGIPAGTSSGWIPLQITAVARRRVTGSVLFAIDTQTRPLRGTAWVDDFVLSNA